MNRTPLLICLALAVPCLVHAQPPAITGVYEELRIAIETEDTNAILGQYAPLMQLEASMQGGWLAELGAMFNQREDIAVELRFDENQVVGPKAALLVTWAFSGKTTDSGEPWSETQQRLEFLVQKGTRWQMLGSERVDPEATNTKITEGRFIDPDCGLEAPVPQGWRAFVTSGAKASLTAFAPDLTALVAWIVTDLPGTFTAEQLARAQEDAAVKLAPTIGIEFRDSSMAPDVLGERPAFRVRRTIVGKDGLDIYSDVTFCVVGSTLYLCSRIAIPPSAYAAHEQTIDRAVAATRIVETEAANLPPEAGRVDGSKYVNDVYGCEITGPEGWTVKAGEGQFKLQVTMYEPGGDSSLSLGMILLPAPEVTAEMAVVGDDNVSSQAFENYKLVKQGETKVGDLPAYESISTFDFGGQTRERHRIYLVDNGRLFFMFADAAPADKWTRLSPLFGEAFGSFRLIEAQPQ